MRYDPCTGCGGRLGHGAEAEQPLAHIPPSSVDFGLSSLVPLCVSVVRFPPPCPLPTSARLRPLHLSQDVKVLRRLRAIVSPDSINNVYVAQKWYHRRCISCCVINFFIQPCSWSPITGACPTWCLSRLVAPSLVDILYALCIPARASFLQYCQFQPYWEAVKVY